jgi:hypothetical protein
MKRFLKRLALGILLALPWVGAASAQQVNLYCWVSAGPPTQWAPCSSSNPLNITGTVTITPSGTQNVNLTQIAGAAPSLTNPLWVSPATGATFPVTQSTSPWIVAGGGTAGSPGTAALTVQGIGSGTPVPVSGTLTVAEPATTNAATTVLASNLVVNAAASSLYSLDVSADSTLSAAAWWIMIFNSTTLPGDGTVTPARCIAMASGSTAYTGAWPVGLPFATGIVVGVSTTGCFTKTASVHAFISGDYK